MRIARRSRHEWPAGADVFLLDTIGEMGLVYGASLAVVMGKTLLPPGGGQNPIEPARFGVPVLHGPYVHNFAEVTAALDAAGGAFEVRDAQGLMEALADWLDDPAAAAAAGARGRAAVDALAGGLDRTWAALEPLLGPDRRA
jgi:3-deoxy-D-manno-octulosonic-acid transferase